MAGGFDRDLSDRLPLPLARLYLRACNAKAEEQGRELHDSVLILFDAAIKLAAAAQVAIYFTDGVRDPKVNQSLTNLTRPALGHWLGWLRDVSAYNEGLAPHPFPDLAHVSGLLREKQQSLPAIRELLTEFGQREEGMPRYNKDTRNVRLLDLFQALGTYRNSQPLAHGGGKRPDSYYEEMGGKLFAAVVEFSTHSPLFGHADLTYVKETRQIPLRDPIVHTWKLMGTDVVQNREPLAVFGAAGSTLQIGHVYLRAEDQLLDLHPLIVCDLPQRPRQVLFLNESQPERAEYVDYEEGGPLSVPQLVPDHQEMLKRINTSGKGVTEKTASSAQKPLRIALLYRRGIQSDEQVLTFLEAQLMANGHQVFVDRRLAFSLERAQEIERQVREADAVIPLLSPASTVDNEILAYEVALARDEAQKRSGKPWLLPVRLNFTGRLPEELARVLDPIQPISWEGTQDNQRLVMELLSALHNGPVIRPVIRPEELKLHRGGIPLDSPFYIARPIDEEFYAAIARRESVVLVKGARQMGKTSVLARGLQRAREAGFKVVLTDFQEINATQLESVDILYQTLCGIIADQLNLEVMPDSTWKSFRGPNQNFEYFMRNEVLGKLSIPLVWGLDEVDQLFHRPFASEVFGLLRAWHNRRALNPHEPWSQLTLVIAHATEPHLFITNLDQSPFNVGTRLTLQDFTFDEIVRLNDLYGSPLQGKEEITRLFHLVGGQPYLVHRSLYELVKKNFDLVTLERQADRHEEPFGDHLGRLLLSLARDPHLCEVVRDLLHGRPCSDQRSFYRLRSGGVILGDTIEDARLRCQVYATYLKQHLL